EELGCQVSVLGEAPDGEFEHPPEPTAGHLETVASRVPETGAVVGFCQDPDADRLAIIDEAGRYIGEEMTLALCLKHVLNNRRGPVVINCATSRMAVDLAEETGVPCHLAPVGEANVVAKMRETGAVFGGEGNGGPIDPEVGMVRDSFVGMALVLDQMAATDKRLSEVVAEIPSYAIVKQKVEWSGGDLSRLWDRLEAYFSADRSSRMDGLRLDWKDRWLLVRPSNTEPIVRLIAEAESESAAAELCEAAGSVLSEWTS
ncbi:MAG TPA: phosphoglucosamine mutase, partial [Planctomycetaceae bacterium]|nr:phosphoglucosamine mutase [Planctomycetaceae bacterium]